MFILLAFTCLPFLCEIMNRITFQQAIDTLKTMFSHMDAEVLTMVLESNGICLNPFTSFFHFSTALCSLIPSFSFPHFFPLCSLHSFALLSFFQHPFRNPAGGHMERTVECLLTMDGQAVPDPSPPIQPQPQAQPQPQQQHQGPGVPGAGPVPGQQVSLELLELMSNKKSFQNTLSCQNLYPS